MILTAAEMRAVEARAFADGVSPESLMEEAARKIADAVLEFAPRPGRCVVFFGKGNNGGDALVASRHLAAAGWEIDLHRVFGDSVWTDLPAEKFRELQSAQTARVQAERSIDGRALVVLDGLLGIGANGPLREPVRSAARTINRLRAETNALVFALDLPSGLDATTGEADPDTVIADYTLTIGCAKTGLLADGAANFVGRLAVLPLEELSRRFEETGAAIIATPASLATLLPRRRFDLHKGDCGRVAIIAGSPGFTGAAVMAAEACVHAGAGLVTLFVSREAQPLVASRIAPEVMVRATDSWLDVLGENWDAIAIGPGLGSDRCEEILGVIERAKPPMIVDADALNALATNVCLLAACAGPRLLTPHPGEMLRLDPGAAARPRRDTVAEFTARFPATLLLKGSRTIVGERGRPLSYNTTGTPGMATGGMGDVLTGVLAALAGQRLALYDAARLGAWLCGRAAEIAISHGAESEESLSATRVIASLGPAFRDLRGGFF